MISLLRASLDVGIVTQNPSDMIAFYNGILGFPLDGEVPIPGQGKIVKLRCGESLIKIFVLSDESPIAGAASGLTNATGIRYLSITVRDIKGVVESCRAAGAGISREVIELRAGVFAALVEDPDRNTIELMEFV